MTPEQQDLVDRIRAVLEADPAVDAAWLAGSLGEGGGDAFSDVDILVLTADGKVGEVSARYAAGISAIEEPVLVNVLFGGRALNVITADWERFDLTFIEAGDLPRHDSDLVTVLFNRGIREPHHHPPGLYQTTPNQLDRLVKEFLRSLGLLPVAVGREEYVLALSGVDHLRRLNWDLMLEENGIHLDRRGAALRRNPLLTPAQRAQFAALAPVAATREGIIGAYAALADIFLPRARRLADRIGLDWPDAFEAATRKHLRRTLGLTLA